MFHPAHIDGRRLVFLRLKASFTATRFEVVAGGWLSYDGESLTLTDGDGRELLVVTDEHLARMQPVALANRIPECSGYNYFILDETP
jgi:hypothetical protein